jgi:sugar phosphate isomerase/epimerase
VTNAFTDRSKTPFENLKVYKEVFGEYAKAAEGEGVRIAVENCPHWVGYPTPVGNIAFSPEMWDAMFGEVPSKAVGLEFDPSHLVWQGIDYLKALVEYGGRVYSFHAKDTEILKDGLYRYGVIGKQIGKESEWDAGWWRYRIPGFGEVNWKGVFNALYEIGYNGPMVIEHEDPVFDGARREEGLRMGLRFLKSLEMD